MPNSIAAPPPSRPEDATPSPAQESSTAADAVQPAAADEDFDAWLEDDAAGNGDGDGDDWLADTNNAPAPAAETTEPAAPAEPGPAEHALPDESSTTSKHLSTMSFTRTVPHEVNWTDDDDDAEWSLPRTNTDPFKFMPDTNRTNSFPLAPPPENETNETPRELEHPVSFSQTEDLLREIEEESLEDEALPDATEAPELGAFSHQYIGSNMSAGAAEAIDTRFEEGVPLVSPAEQAAPPPVSTGSEHALFAEEAAGEEDDFFSNVRTDETTPQDDFQPPTFERKSTLDVLKSLNVGPTGTGFAPLEETAEESEPEEEMPQRQETNGWPEQSSESPQDTPKAAEGENLDAKWEAMFGEADDEDFLPDEATEAKEVDESAFLGSDDEGLLEDSDTELPEQSTPVVSSGYEPVPAPSTQAPSGQYLPHNQAPAVTVPPANPYLPAAAASPTTPANPYLPAAPALTSQPPVATPYAAPPTAPPAPAQYGYGAPPPLQAPPPMQEKSKAQSFADKNRGGYTSPYDLPMEVVKVPKRRTTAQPLQGHPSAPVPPAAVVPPPRSASMYAQPPPQSVAPAPGIQPPQGPPSGGKPPHEGFFEELPMTAKPRPASRQSHNSAPSPTQANPYGPPPPQSAPAPATSHPMPPPGPPVPSKSEAGIPDLVAPPRINPYASLTAGPTLQPALSPVASSRYSPAPPAGTHANGPVPAPPVSSRYSPAPPASRQPSSGYGPVPTTPGPPILPHQPRTSSPLAHFEITHERSRAHGPLSHPEGGLAERRSSSSLHEPRLHRIPSLPPTREVEEEEASAQAQASPAGMVLPQPASPPISRYAPPPQAARQTPPPSALLGHAVLSPPRRAISSHSPLAPPYEFVPPARSQTQSPGALYGNRGGQPVEPVPRPSSVSDHTSPRGTAYPAASVYSVTGPSATTAAYRRPRGSSLNLNVIPPTDGREHDPLQRWRGTPLISWGVGGMFVSMFPKEVPRYGMNQTMPTVVRSPGEVKIQNVKDIIPLEERLAKFPGPLKGKSKKKEAVAWLTAGIETMEQGLPTNFYLHPHLSHEDKRAVERVLLWKILRVFVEHDGVLEGNPSVEKAVRDVLSPELDASANAAPYLNGSAVLGAGDFATAVQSDGVSSSAVEQIRRHLLGGDREKAVWAAADQRLWGHALLLSNALDPELYKKVAQEFVKKEVNSPGQSNEPLAALYGVLSGNHEESVDELVPSHARAGFQLVAANSASGPSKDAIEGLDKWRDTLSLILSNRSADDARSINSLGVLLSGYGRAEASHICFMFARSHTVFGGLDDAASHFVLVGSDHKKQAEQFAKEIEPLLLSEVYEYGQSLAGGANVPITIPHLAPYKLEHALALAEYGFSDKALQYCDAIAAAITSQGKRSPYYHPILENAVEDLMGRLKQAPKGESNSWMTKPSMNKVSDTVWSKFNKFVSGDEDGSGQGPSGEGESGPFGRIAGDTPTISRSPSVSNLETFGAAVPSYGMPAALPNVPVLSSAPPTRAASRYAPGAAQPAGTGSRPSTSAYAPRSSMERSSSEFTRGSIELPRRSLEMQPGRAGNYSPLRSGSPAAMYTPYSPEFNAPQQSPYNPVAQPAPPQPPASAPPYTVGYPGAPVNGESSDYGVQAPSQPSEVSGYQAPSYGYEPPAFAPYEAPAEDKNGVSDEVPSDGSYEPASYQPYSYEPPSYEPDSQPANDSTDSSEELKAKPKKKGIMYDDDDDMPTPKPAERSKEEKDRENAEMFRKAAEEDGKPPSPTDPSSLHNTDKTPAKRAEAAKQGKKGGWGFTSWFGSGSGGAKKEAMDTAPQNANSPNKPIRAKLGEANSFFYDPELKRWVNKNAGPEDTVKKTTAPPPKAAPRSVSASPGPPQGGPSSPGGGAAGRASAPPAGPPRSASLGLGNGMGPPPPSSSTPSSRPGTAGGPLGPPPGPVSMLRSVSNTSTASAPALGGGQGPPRPPTSLSNSSSIDDLLGAAGPRKAGGAKKAKRGARYVDVMGKS